MWVKIWVGGWVGTWVLIAAHFVVVGHLMMSGVRLCSHEFSGKIRVACLCVGLVLWAVTVAVEQISY